MVLSPYLNLLEHRIAENTAVFDFKLSKRDMKQKGSEALSRKRVLIINESPLILLGRLGLYFMS